MTLEEFRLEALRMAIAQSIRENAPQFKETVATLQDWFYNRIIGEVRLSEVPVEKAKNKTLSLPKPASGQAINRP